MWFAMFFVMLLVCLFVCLLDIFCLHGYTQFRFWWVVVGGVAGSVGGRLGDLFLIVF